MRPCRCRSQSTTCPASETWRNFFGRLRPHAEEDHGGGNHCDSRYLSPKNPFAQHDQAENGTRSEHHAHLQRPGDADSHDGHRPNHQNAAQLRDRSDDQQCQQFPPGRQGSPAAGGLPNETHAEYGRAHRRLHAVDPRRVVLVGHLAETYVVGGVGHGGDRAVQRPARRRF